MALNHQAYYIVINLEIPTKVVLPNPEKVENVRSKYWQMIGA